jgi:hypothetical protein
MDTARGLTLPACIRLDLTLLTVSNTLAYFGEGSVTKSLNVAAIFKFQKSIFYEPNLKSESPSNYN